jgi:hypothetical protein
VTNLFIILAVYTLLAFALDAAVSLVDRLLDRVGRIEARLRHPAP